MNNKATGLILAGFVGFVAGLAATSSYAQDKTIGDVVQDGKKFIVFKTNRPVKHAAAEITITRNESGGSDLVTTYDLSFKEQNQEPGKCKEATVFLDDTAIMCLIRDRNGAGKVVKEETIIVATVGSPFCDGLQKRLGTVIIAEPRECTDTNPCLCYDVDHRKPSSHRDFPPNDGSGSGRRN